MVNKIIITKSGKLTEYLHLVDIEEFGIPRLLASYILEFDDLICILDCGSSIDIEKLLSYITEHRIPLEKIVYLIPSHHHFDHNGGLWKLYDEIQKHNPSVKILANAKTKALLNDFKFHLDRGRRTYGTAVGEMKPIDDNAFEIIQPSRTFVNDTDLLETTKTFTLKGGSIDLVIFDTPGHTPDHQSIAIIKNDEIDFIFYGEAVGTLYHPSKLISTPTSMPIFFNHEIYMESFHNLKKLKPPLRCGFGHYGIVNGKENVAAMLEEHDNFMKEFKSKVIQYYNEKPETKHVFKRLIPFFEGRTVCQNQFEPVLDKILLAVVYGMMLSLGFRELEGNEAEIIKKYKS